MEETEITETAANIRQSLRDQGLLPSYTDDGGPGQPPVLQHMLENAVREHVAPLLAGPLEAVPLLSRPGQKPE